MKRARRAVAATFTPVDATCTPKPARSGRQDGKIRFLLYRDPFVVVSDNNNDCNPSYPSQVSNSLITRLINWAAAIPHVSWRQVDPVWNRIHKLEPHVQRVRARLRKPPKCRCLRQQQMVLYIAGSVFSVPSVPGACGSRGCGGCPPSSAWLLPSI